jgi:hypothetical protein
MGSKFIDGPAAGTTLELQRAPHFLRVVIDNEGGVDALDQISDTPMDNESIYVYRMSANLGRGIACSRGKNGGCRSFLMCEYKVHANQPSDDVLRDNDKWSEFAHAEYDKEQCPS